MLAIAKTSFTALSLALLASCGGGDPEPPPAQSIKATPKAVKLATSSSTSSALAAAAVDLSDAIAILKMIVGLSINGSDEPTTAFQAYAADVDANGAVQLADAILVLKRVVGLEPTTENWVFLNLVNGAPVVTDTLNPGQPPALTATVDDSGTTNVVISATLRGDVVSSNTLSFAWSIASKPTGSNAAIEAPTSDTLTFVADVSGLYAIAATVTEASQNTSLLQIDLEVAAAKPSVTQTYPTPANFATLVNRTYAPSVNLIATVVVTNRGRYMLADEVLASPSSVYLGIGTPFSDGTAAGYTITAGTLTAPSTYNDYLTKTIQLVQTSDGFFRLDSHLHPNNSIDVDANTSSLQFRNVFGKTSANSNGYVTFSYDSTTHLLQAKNRYIYSYAASTASIPYDASYTLDSNFTGSGKYVSISGGAYALSSIGIALYLYPTPLELGIPDFMNPRSVQMVSNAAAPFKSKITYTPEEVDSRVKNNIKAAYQPQVAAQGPDATTKTAADAELVKIKSALEANGEKLRYAPAVYTAFRDAALATKLVSDSIADGRPGQNLVPYVYFTNEQDGSGKYHPFMVVVNYGNQASPNGLRDIPRPPGDGTQPYESGKVTRFSNLENYVSMIPMKDYGRVSVVTENTLARTLWSDVPGTNKPQDVYTYADAADNGLLVDGSVMFPIFNNNLLPSPVAGELTASGCHVGQGGGGPHCHADGYRAGTGLGLYNDSDYVGVTHPPLIGFGYDGVALFASYRAGDTSLLGYGTLDAFGGHDHDTTGYHYHAHTVQDYQPYGESTSLKSTMHVLMKGAYIGKVGSIPCFRARSSFNDNKYLGGNTASTSCSP